MTLTGEYRALSVYMQQHIRDFVHVHHISHFCILLCILRELESLIFQSGIQLEELKEWIEQSEHHQLIEPTPGDSRHALQPCVSLKQTEPQPEVL